MNSIRTLKLCDVLAAMLKCETLWGKGYIGLILLIQITQINILESLRYL